MTDRFAAVSTTRTAARKVWSDGNISDAKYKQMTDGTVSRQDIKNAEQALRRAEQKMNNASYGAASGYPGGHAQLRQAQTDVSEAQSLVNAVRDQYSSQGYAETIKENAKDAVFGA